MSMTPNPGKQCPQCGKMLPLTAAFCSMCAARQPKTLDPGASLAQAEDVGINLLFGDPGPEPEPDSEPETPRFDSPTPAQSHPAPATTHPEMDDRTRVVMTPPFPGPEEAPMQNGGQDEPTRVVGTPPATADTAPVAPAQAPAPGLLPQRIGNEEPTQVIRMPSGPEEPTVVIANNPIGAPAPRPDNAPTPHNRTSAGADTPTRVMGPIPTNPVGVQPQNPAIAAHLGNQPWQDTVAPRPAGATGWGGQASGSATPATGSGTDPSGAPTPPSIRRPPVVPAPPVQVLGADDWGPVLPSPVITGIVTFLFGIFGVIPAFISHDRAKQAGASSKKYWLTFAIFFLANTLVALLLVVPVASKALKGASGAGTSNPSTSAGAQPSGGASGSASPGAELEYPPGATECSATAAAGNAETSCEFALAVEKAFLASPRNSTQVVKAHSPVTKKDYEMTCVTVEIEGADHDATTCKGGNNAVVLIRS